MAFGQSNSSEDGIRPATPKEATPHGLEVTPTKTESVGALELDEVNSLQHTAYVYSTSKKWWILTVVALCQTSMSRSFLLFMCTHCLGSSSLPFSLGMGEKLLMLECRL